MKRFDQHSWREPPSFEHLFGISESGKGWIALFVVGIVLVTLVAAFFHSASPTTVHYPIR